MRRYICFCFSDSVMLILLSAPVSAVSLASTEEEQQCIFSVAGSPARWPLLASTPMSVLFHLSVALQNSPQIPQDVFVPRRVSRAFWNAEQISRSAAEWKMLQRTQAGKSALPMGMLGKMSGQKDPGCILQPCLLPLGFLDSPWEWCTHVPILYKSRSKVSWLQRPFASFYQLKRHLSLL